MESAYKNVGFNKLFAVRAKKNGIPLYPNLVNLKSNTMKNTMQRYRDFWLTARGMAKKCNISANRLFFENFSWQGRLSHRAFQTDGQKFLGFDGELHRELVDDILGISADDEVHGVLHRYAALLAVEELVF